MVTIPNVLTLLRLFLVPWFILASYRGQFTLAFVLFVTAAVTDILDGMIARRWNQRSKLGAFLDPAADKTMMIAGYLFYTLHHSLSIVRIPAWLTFTVFVRDVLIVLFVYLLYTRVDVSGFPPSWAGKVSTVTQAVTLAATIAVNAFMPGQLWLAEGLFRVALVITLYSSWDYLRRADRLVREAPAPA